MSVSAWPVYTGFAPIATCHWQSLANILAASGFPDADQLLCPSWGCSWDGGGVLFGGGRWPRLVAELFGIRVEQHTFTDPVDCARFERKLSMERIPFVAEIDAYYVPSPYHRHEHVVHTVIITTRTEHEAVIVDTTNNPVAVTVPIADYTVLRRSPCEGRLDSHKLYVASVEDRRTPTATAILTTVARDLDQHGEADLRCLRAFLDSWPGGAEPVSVCRVAAERFGAARLFEALASRGLEHATALAEHLRHLSDEWYLVHMLSAHPRADDPRQRRRMHRLMRQLDENEQRVQTLLRDAVMP